MAIKKPPLERKLYIREAVIHRPAFEKRLTRTDYETIVGGKGGRGGGARNSRPRGGTILKSPVSTPGISKMTPIRIHGGQKNVANTGIQISRKHTISVCKYVVRTGINYPGRPPAILAPFHA